MSASPVAAERNALPPTTRQAIVLMLGLALSSLLLIAAAVLAVTPESHQPDPSSSAASVPAPVENTRTDDASTDDASSTAVDTPDTELTASQQIPTLYPTEPSPVPQDVITDIEAASGDPLPVELGRLLSGIQEGFGSESVQLAPELRAYVFRMASRFDWNPDTFRVAVTAPSAELAEARATTLRRLFESATGSQRLQIRSGAGPHALTLVSDS